MNTFVENMKQTTKILKEALQENPKSQRTNLTTDERIQLEYEKAISQDINYPLKNLKFISSDVPLCHFENLNREVAASQANKIAKSMLKMGNLRAIVVVKLKYKSKTSKYYILDGQHLYTALLSLKVTEIPVVEISVDSVPSLVEKIAMLNSSSKSWQLKDYVIAWSNIHEDYVTLLNLQKTYDLEFSMISAICTGVDMKSGIPGSQTIKSGKFRIKNLEQSTRKLEDINEILNVLPRMDRAASRYFVASLINVFNEVNYTRANHAKLLRFVNNNVATLKFALNNVVELKEYLLKAFQ
jgi:hypothetical protein